jgi:hypothetical protein
VVNCRVLFLTERLHACELSLACELTVGAGGAQEELLEGPLVVLRGRLLGSNPACESVGPPTWLFAQGASQLSNSLADPPKDKTRNASYPHAPWPSPRTPRRGCRRGCR